MATEEQGAATSAREGSVSRAVGALVSPRETFESIAQKPGWLLPVLLVIAVNLILILSFSYRVGWRTTIERQLASTPAFAQLTPQQQQAQMARAVKVLPIAAYAGSTVGVVVILLIIAAVFLGAFNVILGTSIKFKQSFSIAAYALMPGVVRGLLGVLIVWLRPPEGVSLQNLVMSNVGAFLPTGTPAWLQALGSSIDVFTFWSMALLALGYAAASARKVRFGSALAVVFSVWAVWVLAVVGFSAVVR